MSDLLERIKLYSVWIGKDNSQEIIDLIEQQQQRIEELEHQLTQYRIDNLKIKADNNELAATIYRLRDALQTHTAQPVCCGNVGIKYGPDGEPIGQQCCGWGDFEWPQDVVELLSATPQQSLTEHDAEVARKAYLQGASDAISPVKPSINELKRYAEIYAQRIKDVE